VWHGQFQSREKEIIMSFNASEFELLDTAVLIVQNANGNDDLLVDGKQVKITIYSSGSDQGVKAARKDVLRSQKNTQAIFQGKISPNAGETAEKEQAERLAGLTASIDNFPIEGGALALYSNPKLGFITKQVAKFHAEDGNFTKPSTTN
jgi:hypothetical protein